MFVFEHIMARRWRCPRRMEQWICWWSAAASTAPASRATPPAAAFPCCCASRTTSPAAHRRLSTKLIHGGLRYLEHYEFRLVREALAEREVLLRDAPHIIWPLRFVLPHDALAAGLDDPRSGCSSTIISAAERSLPGTATSTCRPTAARRRRCKPALQARFRLFRLLGRRCAPGRAQRAATHAARGAEILLRTRCVAARREDGQWIASCRTSPTGTERVVKARALVNAAGPWVKRRPRRRRRRSRHRATCGWSRAATSSCRACSRATTRTSCRTPTSASSS